MKHLLATILLINWGFAAAAEDNKSHEVPDWFKAEIEEQTKDGGIWMGDNAEYQSEDEPIRAYVLQWEKAIGGTGITGKMWSEMTDGTKTGIFWNFRSFWHPGKGQVIAEQWGAGGGYLVGTMAAFGEHGIYITQDMYGPDGSVSKTGHTSDDKPGIKDTRSYTISDDGSWQESRHYVWRRKPAE